MFRSLQSRLFFSYLLIAGLMLLLILLGLIVLLRNNSIADQVTYRRMEIGLPFLARRESGFIRDLGTRELEQAIQRLDQILGERVLFIDPDGKVVEDSRGAHPTLPAQTIREVLGQSALTRGRFIDSERTQWLYVSQPLVNGYALLVAAEKPVVRVLASLLADDLLRPLMQAGLIALVFSILFSYLISRWIASPLDRMAHAARAVAEGEYRQDLKTTGPREVEGLALAFNEMIHQVENTQNSQRDFVANVSHELKTPLTSIQGFAQAILDGTASDREARDHAAKVIFDESDRLIRMVEELLDLARIDAGQIAFKRDRVELDAIVANVVERLGPRAAEAQIDIEVSLPIMPAMIGDGDRLAQVFTNLVDNAIKHSPEGGRVRILGESARGWVTIHVEDRGPGIPPEELPRIFERFYQLDKARTGRGVGLGLPISHEIVRNHQGELLATSEIGLGSRFSVRLPTARPDDSTLQKPLPRA